MRKAILYFVAAIAIIIYLLASSTAFMRYYTDKMSLSTNESFRSKRDLYGDLYQLSYISDFRVPTDALQSLVKRSDDTSEIFDLYIIGDSYLAQTDKAAVDSTFYRSNLVTKYAPSVQGWTPQPVTFEQNGRRKVLIIERGERVVYHDFAKPKEYRKWLSYLDGGVQYTKPALSAGNAAPVAVPLPAPPAATFKFSIKTNFRSAIINQNLETLLYGYGLFRPVKELKADLNFRLFNKVSSKVAVSTDHQNLFVRESVDRRGRYSSFYPVKEIVIDSIANNLNALADKYKTLGFDHVIISMLPNTVSVLGADLGTYNHTIERVQAKLRHPFADVYGAFNAAADKRSLFRKADTHWAAEGYALWVECINRNLRSLEAQYSKRH